MSDVANQRLAEIRKRAEYLTDRVPNQGYRTETRNMAGDALWLLDQYCTLRARIAELEGERDRYREAARVLIPLAEAVMDAAYESQNCLELDGYDVLVAAGLQEERAVRNEEEREAAEGEDAGVFPTDLWNRIRALAAPAEQKEGATP